MLIVFDDVPLELELRVGCNVIVLLEDTDVLRLGLAEALDVVDADRVRVPCALREAVVVAEALREGRAVSVV